MARNKWRGDAQAVAMVRSVQVTGAGAEGDALTITINGKDVAGLAPATPTVAEVAAAVVAALQASTIPEFSAERITWSVTGAGLDMITGTASTPGVPFTFTAAAGGTITIGAVSTTTASSGPNHWDTAENWTLGAVPVSTNDVDIQDSNVDILYGIDQNAVTLASLNIDSTYTGKIGLPDWNPLGYYEYLETYLKVSSTLVTVGAGQGGGSGRIRLNVGTNQTTVLIMSTGTAATQGTPAFWFKGTHASNAMTVSGGSVGVAFELGSTAVLTTLGVSSGGGTVPPNVQCGAGLTLTTTNIQGGTVTLQAGHTTCNLDAGTVQVIGPSTASLTTLNGRGGTFYQDAPGTIGTATLSGGTLDFSRDPRAKTVTNCTVNSGTLRDPFKHVTFSNPISCPNGVVGPEDPNGAILALGQQITIARA